MFEILTLLVIISIFIYALFFNEDARAAREFKKLRKIIERYKIFENSDEVRLRQERLAVHFLAREIKKHKWHYAKDYAEFYVALSEIMKNKAKK